MEHKKLTDLAQKATEGNIEAQLSLAHLYEMGIDRPRDYERAASYLQMAIRCGSRLAREKLQLLVDTGKLKSSPPSLADSVNAPPEKAVVDTRPKLLLVDDEVDLVEVTADSLEDAGYRVITAHNGDEGFQRVLQHPDIKVILCDMKMPKVNGLHFIRTLRGTKAAQTAHIIVLSAMAHPDLILESKQLGIATWLLKPVDPEKLISTIGNLLKRKS